jgi:hypothetical protein
MDIPVMVGELVGIGIIMVISYLLGYKRGLRARSKPVKKSPISTKPAVLECYWADPTKGPCGNPATWTHTQWPTRGFCDKHKKMLEGVYRNQWSRIK